MKKMAALSVLLAVSLSMAAPIPSALAHTGCEEDIQDLRQTIMGVESMLETVEREKPRGHNQRRSHRMRKHRLQEMLQANREHLTQAKEAGCHEHTNPLEEQIEFLEHKLEHLSE